MHTLRDYQTTIIDQARLLMRKGATNILIQSPTGSGKTLLTAHMLKSAAERGLHSLFIVHRRELIKQSTRAFSNVGVRHGIIAAGFPSDLEPLVQIASIGSLPRRLHKIAKPKLVIWDECHHVAAGTWAKLHAELPDAFHIGLTATPQRLDGKGLGKWFSKIINGPSVASLIESGHLSKYKLFAPPGISTDGIGTLMGDFNKAQLSELIDKPSITGDAVKEYTKLIPGKRAVVFCISIQHSLHVAEAFNQAGFVSSHVDGDTPKHERDLILKKFEQGEIHVLSNVGLFGEGLDIPGIEAVIDLAPTKSLTNWLQRCGRALRPNEGKEFAYIIDHANNYKELGLPDDVREWDLEGRKKRSSSQGMPVKNCPKCFAILPSASSQCTHCGYIFRSTHREIEEIDGDLVELDPVKVRELRLKEQWVAQDMESLIQLGIKRGYDNPKGWAYYVMKSRKKTK